jgi:hypothetical protein
MLHNYVEDEPVIIFLSILFRQYINSLLDVSNTKDHDDFLLIKCQLAEPSVGDGVQLLILPPKLRRKQTDLLRGKQRISISVILTGTVFPDSGLIIKKIWARISGILCLVCNVSDSHSLCLDPVPGVMFEGKNQNVKQHRYAIYICILVTFIHFRLFFNCFKFKTFENNTGILNVSKETSAFLF